jgi:hypothetical protein
MVWITLSAERGVSRDRHGARPNFETARFFWIDT